MQGSPEDELLLLSKANSFLHSLEPNLIEEIYSNSTLFQDEKITSRQWLQMIVPAFGNEGAILNFLSLLGLAGINWSDFEFLHEYRNKKISIDDIIDHPLKKRPIPTMNKNNNQKRKRESIIEVTPKQKKRRVTKRKCPLNWDEDESQMLVQYVQNENKSKKGGAPNWKECARILSKKFHKERTPSQCSQHWYVQSSHDQTLDLNCRNRVANPKIDKGPWRKAEDEKLLELYDLHNGSWAKISKALGNRPDTQCKRRYEKLNQKENAGNFVE